ncbi:KGK domain-containing protein [Calothrix sp. NIES-3974]|uniref:KGK domain-containing protein n=1 Tax=Calothrix sp. NIES-3974 TaxID=2005462 RepID=UPI000B619D90|nr:KGK domain-containing protein [Calothrix sp. NIES-3974]BAZ06826.1 hypothetical protein NIES3974_34880 [Calothrix sp. NIES-3974]
MEISKNIRNFNYGDVISVKDKIYKTGKVIDNIIQSFKNKLYSNLNEYLVNQFDMKNIANLPELFDSGIECELLQTDGGGWQKGKIKINITLEFIPDQPDVTETAANSHLSPLDDLRNLTSK